MKVIPPPPPDWPWSVYNEKFQIMAHFPTEREAVERAASWERAMTGEVRKVK